MSVPHDNDETIRRSAPRKFVLWGLVAYVAFLSVLLALLFAARRSIVKQTDPREATQAWQQWVEDVKQQSETTGPVQRREPETAEPPALLLLRDLFPLCVTATVVFGTVVFGSFWWLLRGALFAGQSPGAREPDA